MATNMANTEEFVKEYIEAWSTEDDKMRQELIAKVYAEDAVFYADEPGDGPVVCHGLTEIMGNITQVNIRLVQGKGLLTEGTGFAANHNALKVSWKMSTTDGKVAMTGMNFLLRNTEGRIAQDYIFIG